jgi:DNA-binding LacI/PurR family transcriptional regulator
MPVTLGEIAKKLNVSRSTVSRVLNGRGEDFISEQTRQRVLDAIRDMGYRPNLTARALATGRTNTIAVWSSALYGSYYGQLLNALEDELTSHDYRLLVRRSRDPHQDLMTVLQTVDLDGVIVIDAFPAVRGSLALPTEFGAPCVFMGVYSPDFADCVRVDLTAGIEKAISLMLQAGRKRIAYLVNEEISWMLTDEDVRYRVYTKMTWSVGRAPEIIRFPTADCLSAGPSLADYIDRHGCPDGLLCQNDLTAMSAYSALRDHGLRIPEDIAVVGCDGTAEAQYMTPPLSTIAQPVHEMCRLAWQYLKRRIADPTLPVQQTTLSAELVLRKSLGVETAER